MPQPITFAYWISRIGCRKRPCTCEPQTCRHCGGELRGYDDDSQRHGALHIALMRGILSRTQPPGGQP